jgi:hypothetical protein
LADFEKGCGWVKMKINIVQGVRSVKYIRHPLTSSIFSFNKTGLLTSLIALTALCDFLYMLPLLGDVSKQTQLLYLGLSGVIATILAVSLLKDGRISIKKMMVAMWILLVFVVLFGWAPTRLMICAGLVAIWMLHEEQQRLAFEKFHAIFCVIVLVNVLAYPFISLGMLPSLGEIIPDHWLKQEVGMYYENYGISFVLHGLGNAMQVGSFLLYRMSAWFEEPGNVGTIAALLLAATDFKMNWKGKVLLVGGVLSFSLAFFAMAILYTLMKKPKAFLYLVGVLVFSAWYFQDNEFLSSKLFDRIFISASGIAGDNRTGAEFDAAFSQYVETPSVWLGHDADHQLYKLQYNASSWKNLVWDYGIIGAVLYLSTFALVFYRKTLGEQNGRLIKLKQLLPFLIVFVLSIYQRPHVLSLSYFLIFIGAMVWVSPNEKRFA